MENKIIIIESKDNLEIEQLAIKQWAPLIEKIDNIYNLFSHEHKAFICKFAHYLAIFENSKFETQTQSFSIISPDGKTQDDIKSVIPFTLCVILGVMKQTMYGKNINYHLIDSPVFSYLNTSDGILNRDAVLPLNINIRVPYPREVQNTNYLNIQEDIFKLKVIDTIIEAFKINETTDVVIYSNCNVMNSTVINENFTDNSQLFGFVLKFITINKNKNIEKEFNEGIKVATINTIDEKIKLKGHWQVGGPTGISIHLAKKPNRITRFMAKLLLDMEWVDLNYIPTGPMNG